jgi:hypothetical protein
VGSGRKTQGAEDTAAQGPLTTECESASRHVWAPTSVSAAYSEIWAFTPRADQAVPDWSSDPDSGRQPARPLIGVPIASELRPALISSFALRPPDVSPHEAVGRFRSGPVSRPTPAPRCSPGENPRNWGLIRVAAYHGLTVTRASPAMCDANPFDPSETSPQSIQHAAINVVVEGGGPDRRIGPTRHLEACSVTPAVECGRPEDPGPTRKPAQCPA